MLIKRQEDVTPVVVDAFKNAADPRVREILTALVKHLHAMERQSLAQEARLQSERVSRNESDASWYGLADTSGWQ